MQLEKQFKLAILGSGIAGCAAACFAREAFPFAEITVIDRRGRIGGQVLTRRIETQSVEMGGAFVHSSNHLIRSLVLQTGLTLRARPGLAEVPSVGIWDGSHFTIRLQSGQVKSALYDLMPYGRSFLALAKLALTTRRSWSRLYPRIERGLPFESCDEMLNSAALVNSASHSFLTELADAGVSTLLANHVVSGIVRGVFMQDLEINGLAGRIALIAAGFSGGRNLIVEEGLGEFCQRLLTNASARIVLDQDVEQIVKRGYRAFDLVDSHGNAKRFDAVISAVPVSPVVIGCSKSWEFRDSTSRATYVTAIQGKLATAFFGARLKNKIPRIILTASNSTAPFVSITRAELHDGTSVVKVQTTGPLPESVISRLFTVVRHCQVTAWTDRPDLSPSTTDRPFRLTDGLYDAAAMVRSLSTMESQAMGGWNAVQLLKKDLQVRDSGGCN